MPTVTNYDVLDTVPWGQGRQAADRDRSDARAGFNMLLFDNGSPCSRPVAVPVTREHAYAVAATFVSSSGYYGFHPQHQDCSMDTSENTLPVHVGRLPRTQNLPDLPGQNAWHAVAAAQAQSRKRRPGPGAVDGEFGNDHGLAAKRSKCSPLGFEHFEGTGTGAPISAQVHALAPGFGVQSSTPSVAPTQMSDLPKQQLPGSTSQLADAMNPRPRCLMGHFT